MIEFYLFSVYSIWTIVFVVLGCFIWRLAQRKATKIAFVIIFSALWALLPFSPMFVGKLVIKNNSAKLNGEWKQETMRQTKIGDLEVVSASPRSGYPIAHRFYANAMMPRIKGDEFSVWKLDFRRHPAMEWEYNSNPSRSKDDLLPRLPSPVTKIVFYGYNIPKSNFTRYVVEFYGKREKVHKADPINSGIAKIGSAECFEGYYSTMPFGLGVGGDKVYFTTCNNVFKCKNMSKLFKDGKICTDYEETELQKFYDSGLR